MANFCSSCGSPAAANKTFCPQCGSPQQQAPAAVPPAPPRPAVVPAKKGGGALKILLIVFVFFLALVTLAGAGLWYAAHKVRQAAIAKAHELGVELPSSSSRAALPEVQVCDLLSKSEVAKLLGEPVERSEKTSGGCIYYGLAGMASQLAHDRMSAALNHSSKTNDAGIADAITNLASAAGAAPGHDGPLLTVIVANDGHVQMNALSASRAIFSGIRGGVGTDVPNLGDRAVMLAPLGLNVLQGDRIIRVVPGPVPSPREKSIAVARAVLAKL
jgi:hypothetical protein